MCRQRRKAITMVEVAVIIAIVVVLAALLLPATRNAREAARRMSCSSNIRQFGIGVLNYEYSYKKLPSLSCGFGLPEPKNGNSPDAIDKNSIVPNAGRWGAFVGLVPFMEIHNSWYRIEKGFDGTDAGGNLVKYGPYGQHSSGWATPADFEYTPVSNQITFFRCPSDPSGRTPPDKPRLARTNYAFNLGDSQAGTNLISLDEKVVRGPFMRGLQLNMSDITDGRSSTIMFGEIATSDRDTSTSKSAVRSSVTSLGVTYGGLSIDPSKPLRGIDVRECRDTLSKGKYKEIELSKLFFTQGTRWLDALPCYTGFMTINPPCAASCASSLEDEGIYSAGGYHVGGAQVVMFDNSVKFISEAIDTAIESRSANEYYTPGIAFDPKKKEWIKSENWKGESPFGVWGAMGTIDLNENMESDIPADPAE